VSAAAPPEPSLPPGIAVAWDDRAALWRGGDLAAGGSPWGLLRLTGPARTFARRLQVAGCAGLVPSTPLERALADRFVERGLAHPVPAGDGTDLRGRVVVVIPVHGRPQLLDACLASLRPSDGRDDTGPEVVVVDDASPDPAAIAAVVARHGARLLRHATNRGPGAARDTGLVATDAEVVAFLDADCVAPPGWLGRLVAHLDDPRVAIVAPRVRPRPTDASLLARHEDARSALDMGRRPELVREGATLGFLPSAALVVRRAALPAGGFDPRLRVGEDVDLVWRVVAAGWHARYDPAVTVTHEPRLAPVAWAGRRYVYGTSAAALDRRHPGRLAPWQPSGWNVVVGGLLAAGRPRLAAATAVLAAGLLTAALRRDADLPADVAGRVVAKGLVADAAALGHVLRREWWPLGWWALVRAGRGSSRAGAAATTMLAPIAWEHLRTRPRVDPLRYTLLRLVEDAAYGSGVVVSAVAGRRWRALAPRVRWPGSPRRPDGRGRRGRRAPADRAAGGPPAPTPPPGRPAPRSG
jgi:mycofactocin system glycosyltransferase